MKNDTFYNISKDLTEAFMEYQFRIDNPFPPKNETPSMQILKYQSDLIFRNKVDTMVSGIMHIISKHISI